MIAGQKVYQEFTAEPAFLYGGGEGKSEGVIVDDLEFAIAGDTWVHVLWTDGTPNYGLPTLERKRTLVGYE